MVKIKNVYNKCKNFLYYHLTDCVASQSIANPLFAFHETIITGMSDKVSINARITSSLGSIAGVGSLFSRLRNVSRKIFKITDNTKESIKILHDTAYAVVFTGVYYPLICFISGERDPKKILVGDVMGMTTAAISGGVIGYSIDAFRDLAGLETCNRKSYPELIRKQKPRFKKTLAALLATASIGIMSGIYSLTPPKPEEINSIPEDKIILKVPSKEIINSNIYNNFKRYNNLEDKFY